MYIEIDDSIADILSHWMNDHNSVRDDILTNIDDILTSSEKTLRDGTHCVKTKDSRCAKIISLYAKEKLTPKISNIFSSMYSKYSTYLGGLKKQLEMYVNIGNWEEKIKKEDSVIYVTIAFAARQEFWNRPYFMPENIDDDKYISWIVDYTKKDRTVYKDIKYTYETAHGGGTTALDVFVKKIKEDRFIFALIDSDKKSESGQFGKTAQKFEAKKNEFTAYPNGMYYILQVHEIENLFSSTPFLKLAKSNTKTVYLLDQASDDVRRFFDIKKGYTYRSYSNNNYISDKIRCDATPCENHKIEGKCSSEKQCGKIVIEGWGSDYLKKLFTDENIHKDDFLSAPKKLDAEIRKEWEIITKKFLTFFCALPYKISTS